MKRCCATCDMFPTCAIARNYIKHTDWTRVGGSCLEWSNKDFFESAERNIEICKKCEETKMTYNCWMHCYVADLDTIPRDCPFFLEQFMSKKNAE